MGSMKPSGAFRPGDRAILLGKGQFLGLQAISNPLKHFFRRYRNQHWLASNAVENLEALFRLDNAKYVLGPRRVGGKSEKTHQRRPGLIPLVSELNRSPHSSIRVQFFRDSHQMPHGMLPV